MRRVIGRTLLKMSPEKRETEAENVKENHLAIETGPPLVIDIANRLVIAALVIEAVKAGIVVVAVVIAETAGREGTAEIEEIVEIDTADAAAPLMNDAVAAAVAGIDAHVGDAAIAAIRRHRRSGKHAYRGSENACSLR